MPKGTCCDLMTVTGCPFSQPLLEQSDSPTSVLERFLDLRYILIVYKIVTPSDGLFLQIFLVKSRPNTRAFFCYIRPSDHYGGDDGHVKRQVLKHLCKNHATVPLIRKLSWGQ